jgi:Txe/YoeB family toxin of Txe-Axe toxin-antitoxin module
MNLIRPSEVVFVDDNTEKEFDRLSDNDGIKKYIKRAIEDIKKNAFCGIQLPKKLILNEYVQKYNPKNLWKYDLPDRWRLVYTIITPSKVEIVSVILEWFDHPDYERRFGYK